MNNSPDEPNQAGKRPGGYVLITPARDEAEYAEICIQSVLAQTIQPTLWVIVDDGSRDETPAILDALAAKHPWVQVIHRKDRGKRLVGPGVMDAFYAGHETIRIEDYDYVCKFDLDMELPPRYFEILMERMQLMPRLGTCSGKAYFREKSTGRLISEKCGDEMSVGMTKFYRVECFKEIGGFVREVMWDGIDCHRCRMLGWIARSWDEPDIRFIHLRAMGSSQKGILTGRRRHGFGQYFMGTSLAYILVSALFRLRHPPFLIGSLAMLNGYLGSLLQGKERYNDLDFIKFLRHYQWQCLFYGKHLTTEKMDRRAHRLYAHRAKVESPGV